MTTMQDVEDILRKQGDQMDEFRRHHLSRVDDLEKELLGLKRAHVLGGSARSFDTVSEAKLADGYRAFLAGNQDKAYECFREAKAMQAGTDPDGGYVVHATMSREMTKVMEEISPVYRLSRVIPLDKSDSFEEPIDRNAAAAFWVGETTARGDTATPQLGLFRVGLKEIYAQPKTTQTLIEDTSFEIVRWLSEKVGEAFAAAEGDAFHNGDGVAKPRGFLSYTMSSAGDATRAWGELQYVGTGASGAFPTSSTTVNPADVLVDVTSAMRAQYRGDAVWLMNRTTAGVVRKLKDAEGRHVWVDSLVQGQPSTLLGYPVEIDEEMPDISAGSYSIAFANLKRAYTIVERPGLRFLTDPYTDKPHVRLYSYRRVGGGVNNFEAIKLLRFS